MNDMKYVLIGGPADGQRMEWDLDKRGPVMLVHTEAPLKFKSHLRERIVSTYRYERFGYGHDIVAEYFLWSKFDERNVPKHLLDNYRPLVNEKPQDIVSLIRLKLYIAERLTCNEFTNEEAYDLLAEAGDDEEELNRLLGLRKPH